MHIRLAEHKDALDILRWRNDEQTRAMSRDIDLVDEKAHLIWFEKLLENKDRVLMIGSLSENSIGMVRFDRHHDLQNWEVSIVLAPEQRSKGLSRVLLMLSLAQFLVRFPEAMLLAEVKRCNAGSRRLFESAGFTCKSQEEEEILLYHFNKRNVEE